MTDPRQQGVPDPRAAVRVATFERVMNQFNVELGAKVAATLQRYDEEMVRPRIAALEARVAALEKSKWEKIRNYFSSKEPVQ